MRTIKEDLALAAATIWAGENAKLQDPESFGRSVALVYEAALTDPASSIPRPASCGTGQCALPGTPQSDLSTTLVKGRSPAGTE